MDDKEKSDLNWDQLRECGCVICIQALTKAKEKISREMTQNCETCKHHGHCRVGQDYGRTHIHRFAKGVNLRCDSWKE